MEASADVRFSLETAFPTGGAGASGAIAVVSLLSDSTADLDHCLSALTGRRIEAGRVVLARVADIDDAVIARWSPTFAQLMPHSGPAVLRALRCALLERGLKHRADNAAPRERYPEAATLLDACLLDALSRAASSRSVDALLIEAQRWREAGGPGGLGGALSLVDAERSLVMDRLLEPPLVVAVGAANIGKSSLLNALAGRHEAIVADEPGTTRDCVGVLIDLEGLIVRWVDTPGLRLSAESRTGAGADAGEGAGEGAGESGEASDVSEVLERNARRLGASLYRRADVFVVCEDAAQDASGGAVGPVDLTGVAPGPIVRVLTRADLSGAIDREGDRGGASPGRAGTAQESPIATSSQTGLGLDELTRRLVDVLLPADVVAREGLWRFHRSIAAPEPDPRARQSV